MQSDVQVDLADTEVIVILYRDDVHLPLDAETMPCGYPGT